jgi:autotransporter-associated beta strand protein
MTAHQPGQAVWITLPGSGRLLFSGNNKTYTGDTAVARGELAALGDELVIVITDTSRLPHV